MSRKEKNEYMFQLVDQWQKSGLSQAEFAKTKGINVVMFRYWIQKNQTNALSASPFIQLSGYMAESVNLRYPNGVEITLPSQTPVQVIKSLIYL